MVTNPQTSQVENVSPIWGPIHPLPEIKVAQVMSSLNMMKCHAS